MVRGLCIDVWNRSPPPGRRQELLPVGDLGRRRPDPQVTVLLVTLRARRQLIAELPHTVGVDGVDRCHHHLTVCQAVFEAIQLLRPEIGQEALKLGTHGFGHLASPSGLGTRFLLYHTFNNKSTFWVSG